MNGSLGLYISSSTSIRQKEDTDFKIVLYTAVGSMHQAFYTSASLRVMPMQSLYICLQTAIRLSFLRLQVFEHVEGVMAVWGPVRFDHTRSHSFNQTEPLAM